MFIHMRRVVKVAVIDVEEVVLHRVRTKAVRFDTAEGVLVWLLCDLVLQQVVQTASKHAVGACKHYQHCEYDNKLGQ